MKNPGEMVEQELVGFGRLLQLQSGPENPWQLAISPCGYLSGGTVLLRMELSKHQSPVSRSYG